MNNYAIHIEVPEGKVGEILDRMTTAQEAIRQCYEELIALGVLVVKEETASGN